MTPVDDRVPISGLGVAVVACDLVVRGTQDVAQAVAQLQSFALMPGLWARGCRRSHLSDAGRHRAAVRLKPGHA